MYMYICFFFGGDLERRTERCGNGICAGLLAVVWLTLSGVKNEVFDVVCEEVINHEAELFGQRQKVERGGHGRGEC